jgi:hypothetical protein
MNVVKEYLSYKFTENLSSRSFGEVISLAGRTYQSVGRVSSARQPKILSSHCLRSQDLP